MLHDHEDVLVFQPHPEVKGLLALGPHLTLLVAIPHGVVVFMNTWTSLSLMDGRKAFNAKRITLSSNRLIKAAIPPDTRFL